MNSRVDEPRHLTRTWDKRLRLCHLCDFSRLHSHGDGRVHLGAMFFRSANEPGLEDHEVRLEMFAEQSNAQRTHPEPLIEPESGAERNIFLLDFR